MLWGLTGSLRSKLIFREEAERQEALRKEQEERDRMVALSISEDNQATLVKEELLVPIE